MANRPQGCQSLVMSADGVVVAEVAGLNKPVYALIVATNGATVGDIVVLRDGGATGKVKVKFRVTSATGTQVVDLGRYGVNFSSGIYYSELATAALKIETTVIYG